MFDVLVDELRTHSTEWLRRERDELVAQQRRLRTRELAVLAVLDERGKVDVSVGGQGESSRTVREKVETARALESLPAIASTALEGGFSDEQLTQVVRLADEASDAEWAVRAPGLSPADLARRARSMAAPTADEGVARHAARVLRTWWDEPRGMLQIRGELPDVIGATFQATLDRITDRMRPPKGQPWAPRERRQADALLALCHTWADAHPGPTAAKPLLGVEVPEHGPAEVAGIPLPATMVEQLRASASIEPVLVDDAGFATAVGKRGSAISAKLQRAVLRRDGHCRCDGGCDIPWGLQVHHLRPVSWGGTDELSNLVAIFAGHHPDLIPNGPYALVGNPNQPDGIRRKHISQLTAEEAAQVGLPPPTRRPRSA